MTITNIHNNSYNNGNVETPSEVKDTAINIHEYVLLSKEQATKTALEMDKLPIPPTLLRENYYGDRHFEYWLSGFSDWQKVYHVAGERQNAKYLDFGGCTGRVARHAIQQSGNLECWLCDINQSYIDWLEQNIPSIRTLQNDPFPHLPFESNSFDIITAFSVFSHLDQDALSWLLELKRILKPGGILYITVLDESSWERCKHAEWLRHSVAKQDLVQFTKDVSQPMNYSRYVIKYAESNAYNLNIFRSDNYIRKYWGRYFSEIDVQPNMHNYQTVIIFKK